MWYLDVDKGSAGNNYDPLRQQRSNHDLEVAIKTIEMIAQFMKKNNIGE